MNLIDQLGGYEKAKRALEREIRLTSPNTFYCLKLDEALLEHRSQHNIYEAGDLVAYRTLPYERLFSVRYVGGDEIVIYELWDEMGAKTFIEMHPYSDIRHATDAEIKAGKRLEVG